jgi:hypothetical protein
VPRYGAHPVRGVVVVDSWLRRQRFSEHDQRPRRDYVDNSCAHVFDGIGYDHGATDHIGSSHHVDNDNSRAGCFSTNPR